MTYVENKRTYHKLKKLKSAVISHTDAGNEAKSHRRETEQLHS